jgi:hypothetical protein
MLKGSCRSSNNAFRAGAGFWRAAAGRLVAFLAIVLPIAVFAPAAIAARAVDFGSENPSKDVRHIADWSLESGDNHGLPYAIIDKTAARLYVFKPDGTLRGAAPVLLGIAKGDDSVPGIGDRPLSAMPPEVRTTPAGRFEVSMGLNAHGKTVVWVDYDAAVSMHRVINTNPKERRPHRLETPTPLDNRISYGCINVPIKFFDDVVEPSFEGTDGIVYVLPEVHAIQKMFAAAYEGSPTTHAALDTQKSAAAPALSFEGRPAMAVPGKTVHRVAAREDAQPASPRFH